MNFLKNLFKKSPSIPTTPQDDLTILAQKISRTRQTCRDNEMQTYRCNKELKQKQMEYDRLLHLKYTDLGQIQEIINYFLAKLEKAKSDNRCRMGTNDNRYKINEYHATINCLDRLYKERLNEHTQYPAINDIRNAVDGGKL